MLPPSLAALEATLEAYPYVAKIALVDHARSHWTALSWVWRGQKSSFSVDMMLTPMSHFTETIDASLREWQD